MPGLKQLRQAIQRPGAAKRAAISLLRGHVWRHDPGGPVPTAPIILEENVWVGAAAGLLPGTRIGRNSVVGFGSVCTWDYPANAIIAGNPARVVRELRESERTPPSLDQELRSPSLGKTAR